MAEAHAAWDDLATLIRLPANPKDHDLQVINASVGRFGFLEPIVVNDVTGRVIAGHGRLDTLQGMKAAGKDAPKNVRAEGGKWLVPTWHVEVAEKDEYAAAIALNKAVELGGWHEDILVKHLADYAASDPSALLATGFDQDDVDVLLAAMSPSPAINQSEDEDGDGPDAPKMGAYRLIIVCQSQADFDLLLAGLSADVSELGEGKTYTVPYERIVLPGIRADGDEK